MGTMKIDAKKTAMMIIDMQKAFVEPGAALCIKGAKATVPGIAAAVDRARKAGVMIIWVKRVHKADGSDMEPHRKKMLEEKGIVDVLSPDSSGINSIEDAEGLNPREGDTELIKIRYSAFARTGLDDMLREKGIDTIVLTGTTTPNCVRATAYDGITFDYRTVVLEDLCSSNTDEIQRVNMEDMERAGCLVMSSAEFFEELE